MRRGLLVGAGLLVPAVVQAATLLVPEEYGTVQAGIDAAAEGDTVLVDPGTYSGETRIFSVCGTLLMEHSVAVLRPGVVLKSAEGPDVTVLDGGPLAGALVRTVRLLDVDGPGASIEGFTITGGGTGASVGCTSSEVTFRNCRIVGNHFNGLDVAYAGVRLEDCVVEDNEGGSQAGVSVGSDGEFVALNTVFKMNPGGSLDAQLAAVVRVEGCEFRDHFEERAVSVQETQEFLFMDCLFLNNVNGDRAPVMRVSYSNGSIEGSTFALNRCILGPAGAVEVGVGGDVAIRGNTFYRCEATGAGGAILWLGHSGSVRNNVVVECSSGALANRGSMTGSGCNLLWNNVSNYSMWPEEAQATDFEADPQFCDPEGEDFHVAASSPCLPGNHLSECSGLIGSHGEGCPSAGRVPVGLRTLPDNISLVVDGTEHSSPRLDVWTVGSTHQIGVPPSPITPIPEARYTFHSWSDGGTETHEVLGAETYLEYAAMFDAEYLLSPVADSGGTVTPEEWVPRGESREVSAIPDSAWTFLRWEGAGDGSYSGPNNPAAVIVNGPIVQRAILRNDAPLLTMLVQGSGAVVPETGRQARVSIVAIEAFPDPGWAFSHWIGEGVGSYSGTNNPAQVQMHVPITQTAVFVDATPILTMNVVGGGEVTPATGLQDVFTQVAIEATPTVGWEFSDWTGTGSGSYSGPSNPAAVVMNEPIVQTANFIVGELPLVMVAEEGGTVTPEGGDVTSFTDVEIEAIPDPGHRFVRWKGEGDGSYTGTDNPATVTLNGPITQVAHFEPAAFSVTLSLSDTDPHVHTGSPIGLGNVHLWVTCGSTERGLRSMALKTAGSLQPLAFLPAPGVAAIGTDTVLASIDGCPDGPVRLGSFLVNAPGEGSLCLEASGAVTGLTITDCEGATYSWPENVGFVGVHTGGGSPCGGGTGCEEIGPFAAPVGAPDIGAPPSTTRLAGIFPNPFSGETTVHLDVERLMTVRVSVFDVAGRQIRTLEDRSVAAGRHSVQWDGRDASGRSAAAGIYFVRLQGDGVDETGKVTLLRRRP